MHQLVRTAACCVLMLVVVGCSEDPTDPAPTPAFTITGGIDNPMNIAIPPTVKIVVVWGVTATSPDYAYVFGNGSIDRSTSTFRIEVPTLPPDSALNAWGTDTADAAYGRLGVCYIALYDDPANELRPGRAPDDGPTGARPYGAIDNTAIIYRKGANSAFSNTFPWVNTFPQGISLGRGVEVPDALDVFEPIPNANVRLKIDTVLTSFTFPDWS